MGEQTGPAVADILFGLVEPIGRLPVSFPYTNGQQPWSYDRAPTGRPAPRDDPLQPGRARWRDAPDAALYPFGSGMGYTRFALREVIAPSRADRRRPLTIEVHIANVGVRPGTAFVRADLRPTVATRSPVRRMAGFARATVEKGETSVVPLTIAPDQLAAAHLFTGPSMGRVEITILLGSAMRMLVLDLF